MEYTADARNTFFETLENVRITMEAQGIEETDRVLDIVKSRRQVERKAMADDLELFARMVNAQNRPAPTPTITPVAVPQTPNVAKTNMEHFRCGIGAAAMVIGAVLGWAGFLGAAFVLFAAGLIISLSAGIGEEEGYAG